MEELTVSGAFPLMSEDPNLPGELKDQLLALTVDRLSTGATLVTEGHFQKAMEEGYQALTGSVPSAEIKTSLVAAIKEVNEKNPEVLLIPGLENFITKSFLVMVRKMKWGVLEVQERGNDAMRNFIKQDVIKNLMAQLQIAPTQLNIRRCFSRVNNQVAGKEDPQQQRAAARLAQVKAAAQARAATQTRASAAAQPVRRIYMLEPVSTPNEEEVQQWEQKEKKAQAQMRKKQMANLLQNMDAYVQQGKLSPEDAERLSKVHKVDEAIKAGKVSEEKGSRIRNSIMSGNVRDKLDKKVRDAVDYIVLYTQFFAGLKRIDPKYDDALRFLARHKEIVNADKIEKAEMGPAVSALIADIDCLNHLIEMMDRQEAEVRMIAAGLPPYSNIMRRGQERIENMVIEEEFVDDLRSLSEDDLAVRLNAPDKQVQVRVAADMMCMNALINRLIKATPFRKELRILKLNLIVEEFFRSTDNVEEARAKAEEFLKNRLSSLYPDMSLEETAEIGQIGADIIEAAEQKVQAERAEAQKATAEKPEQSEKGDEKEGELNQDEIDQGILIGRVARRVAGSQRLFRQKIMADPEEPSRFVLVHKDPDSGEMIPIMRRGSKAYVEKNREGVWEAV